MKKRFLSILLAMVMAFSILPTASLAAGSVEEALGEIDIYNGGQELSYLMINGRVRTLIYTYYNYVNAKGEIKEIPAYCVNPNTTGVPQTVDVGESIEYLAEEKTSDPKVLGMLLQEEQYIIHWLTEYGPLPKAQIVRMLKDKPPKTAEKIIRALKNEVMLHEISGGYYLGVDPMCQPDQRMILAVWVLLQFIDRVDPMAHYPATYPSQIFFLKEDIGYEIVVLYDGEQHLTRLLQPQEDLRYILVLPHINMAQELVLPSAPHLFATVDYNGQETPDVRFFTESEGDTYAAV